MIDKLTEECTENIDKVKIADENECECSYTICVVLVVIAIAINIGIGVYFAYSHWYLKKMLLLLSLAHVLNGILIRQQFNRWNSIELINGKIQTNRDQKLNLLFLQRHN